MEILLFAKVHLHFFFCSLSKFFCVLEIVPDVCFDMQPDCIALVRLSLSMCVYGVECVCVILVYIWHPSDT